MRKTLPGTKQPRIPRLWHLSEYLPDARYASLPDVAARWRSSPASLQSTHTTLAVNDEANAETDGQTQRIRSMQVGAVAGGTGTVQLQGSAAAPARSGGTAGTSSTPRSGLRQGYLARAVGLAQGAGVGLLDVALDGLHRACPR